MAEPLGSTVPTHEGGSGLTLLLSWLFVGIPLVYGVWQVVVKTMVLFK